MLHQTLNLPDFFPALGKGGFIPTLRTYVIENSPEIDENRRRPGILICPGGGYAITSAREAEPVALQFAAAGFSAFVLDYSVNPVRYPGQLLEVSAAMALMRRNAAEWHLDEHMLAVCGFSAGGHLAACLGTLFDDPVVANTLNLAPQENRPDAMILCYPVITGGDKAHRGSFDCLLGEGATPAQLHDLSLENRVSAATPPAFLWHTFNDPGVPVENSLLFANALCAAGVEFDLHIYRDGPHGLSLCDYSTARQGNPAQNIPHAATWMKLSVSWLRDLFHYQY